MKSSPPKLAIFDLDGTLLEFPHDFLFAEADRIIELLGHPAVPRDELENCFSDFDFFSFVRDRAKEEFTDAFWTEFNWHHFPKAPLLPGALELLRELRSRGIKTGIATARVSTAEDLKRDIETTGIVELMDAFAPRESEHLDWQDKAPQILRLCQELGVEPQECIMLGDIPPDVLSAKAVGVKYTVAVTSGGIKESKLVEARPDYLFPNLLEFLNKVL